MGKDHLRFESGAQGCIHCLITLRAVGSGTCVLVIPSMIEIIQYEQIMFTH